MFMRVLSSKSGPHVYPELAGARVLITGLMSTTGVDVARAFAEHKARLVLQSPQSSPEITAVAALLAEAAAEIKLFNDAVTSADDAVRFAQTPAQAYGGLDAVINLVTIDPTDLAGRESVAEIEEFVSSRLASALFITRVAANRMRLTWTEGSILNVVIMPAPANSREASVADVVRATVAAITRAEASEWAQCAIRINAVGPRSSVSESKSGACLTCEADVAALALYLAGKNGRRLSGHVFDAEGCAVRRC